MSGTGEGTDGAPPAVAVEPSPRGGGQPLSAVEQQQIMQGDNGAASTPVRGGMTHKVMARIRIRHPLLNYIGASRLRYKKLSIRQHRRR